MYRSGLIPAFARAAAACLAAVAASVSPDYLRPCRDQVRPPLARLRSPFTINSEHATGVRLCLCLCLCVDVGVALTVFVEPKSKRLAAP